MVFQSDNAREFRAAFHFADLVASLLVFWFDTFAHKVWQPVLFVAMVIPLHAGEQLWVDAAA